jgi:hypothetical protein
MVKNREQRNLAIGVEQKSTTLCMCMLPAPIRIQKRDGEDEGQRA